MCAQSLSELIAAAARVRLIAWRLPENAVCAILPMLPDGLVRIVYDPAKPDVIEHVHRMLVEQSAEAQRPD